MVLNLSTLKINSSNSKDLKNGAIEIVERIKPNWKSRDLHFKVYTDGITNKLVGIWEDDRDDQILVRVYGEKTELFIDRMLERKNIEKLHKHGLGPKLYAAFQNGLSYAFIPGVPINVDNVRDDVISRSICNKMAAFHKMPIENKKSCFFEKMFNFVNLLPDQFIDQHNRLQHSGVNKSFLTQEIDHLEGVLTSLDCPIVFTHNDLLLHNILWDKSSQAVHFIDYEYAMPNYQAFDIANHFCEFVGLDENIDYEKNYPSEEFQRNWLRYYLAAYFNKPEAEISDAKLDKWLTMVAKFSLASHFFWGCWALLQACHSALDFDFIGYSLLRINEYKKRKSQYLG